MKVSQIQLLNLLKSNVCDITFVRRLPKNGNIRRMICTLDKGILESTDGRVTLNYMPPTQPPKYNYFSKNLLNAWDIIMQDWRMINMDDCFVNETIKSEDFWKYFNEILLPMSSKQKLQLMNK